MARPTNPETFPPQLMAANTAWNNFVADNLDFVLSYSERRSKVLEDWNGGVQDVVGGKPTGLITTETKDLRLKELYEDNLPLSRMLAEHWLAIRNAEFIHSRQRNKETLRDAPYWALTIDDTLKGGVGHEPTKRKVFYEGDLDGQYRQPDGSWE